MSVTTPLITATIVPLESRSCPYCSKEYSIPQNKAERVIVLGRFRTHKCNCPSNPKQANNFRLSQ
jgi:transposase-like protein